MASTSPWVLRIPPAPRTFDRASKTGSAFEIGRPRHTAMHGLTVAAIAFVIMGGAYCLVSAARGAAYSLHHPHPAVVAEAGR